ncbi:aminotransferase class IV [Frisingicoccus sp.]|uniref:aminotransferase class IV n=1 Tax=Frisingicoccus sp. TaxID=1918627 RepID=UPI002A81EE62|nr:aminotransferase class IV [Frisingicoccus sp.]MDY4835189.1 aminotransferase class IV [Frisingicoccus sp.]MDY4923643.1 aminotransferase class IV [Frisingicoccus sp.]
MKHIGYYNGEIGPLEEMKIPMLDRAVYFGDGCYDAAMFSNNRIFALEDHLDRFYNSCRLLEIPFDMERKALTKELQKCIDANELSEGMIYWQCSRGTYYRSHNFPPETVKPNLMIFTVPDEIVPMDTTYKLISMEDTRFLHCNIKTLNLIPSVIAYQRCIEAGCQETLFHRQGRVTECAHSNVLILKDGTLHTPPRDNLILPGITLKHLILLAKENNIPVIEAPFSMDELKNADEVIISNSGAFCIRADELDGEPIGGKDPKTLKILQDAYKDKFRNSL